MFLSLDNTTLGNLKIEMRPGDVVPMQRFLVHCLIVLLIPPALVLGSLHRSDGLSALKVHRTFWFITHISVLLRYSSTLGMFSRSMSMDRETLLLLYCFGVVGAFIQVPDDRLAWQAREHVGHETVAVPP